jgi:CRP/FNR family transcriptional regulator
MIGARRPGRTNDGATPNASGRITAGRVGLLARLRGIGAKLELARGRIVVEQDAPADCVIEVIDGALRSVRFLSDGRRAISRFPLAGEFYGLAAGDTHSHTVEAVVGSTIVRYPRRKFEELLAREPQLAMHFLGIARRGLLAAQEYELLLSRKSPVERLAGFLLTAAYPGSDACGTEIRLPMTRTDVADHLGLASETVSRLITSLRKRRIIELPETGRIRILRRPMLESISEGGAGHAARVA